MPKYTHLLRAKNLNLDRIKLLVPKILIESRDYLATEFGPDLTYDKIKEFWPEHYGDLDNCRGHYNLQTRTHDALFSGRLEISFMEKTSHTGAPESELDIAVINQDQGRNLEKSDYLAEKIKKFLEKEKIDYREVEPYWRPS